MQIKTLAQILAESDTDSASSALSKRKTPSKQSGKKSKPTQTEWFDRKKQKKAQTLKQDSTDSNTDFNTDSSEYIEHKRENTALIDESRSIFFSEDLSDDGGHSKPSNLKSKKRKKNKKRFHAAATFIAEPNNTPIYKPPEPQSIQAMLAEVKRDIHGSDIHGSDIHGSDPQDTTDNQSNPHLVDSTNSSLDNESTSMLSTRETDNLPAALKAYLRTPEQKQAEIDAIKAESRLRWLAFYYLSRREYGKAELKQKLLDKEQDPDKIDELLNEFEEKGYQSDYRTTLMLIRENIRKGRGRERIKQAFYKKKVALPSNIDELIDMANAESDEFSEFVVEDEDSLVEGVDWLKLAVEARTKKYGNDIPTDQKEKARQLRFLQYRGFKSGICFQALNYTLETLDERF